MLSQNAQKSKHFIAIGLFVLGILSAIVLSLKNNYWTITTADYYSLECYFLHIRLSYLEAVTLQLQNEGIYKAFTWFLDHNSAYYLYLSYLATAFDLDAGKTFIIAQFFAILFLMGVFPVLMYKITKRVSFALASIVLFFLMPNIVPASMFQINDCYWVYYWVLMIGVPILYILLTNEWSNKMWGYTLLLCFTLAIAQLVRSNAGVFLWIALIGVVIYKNIATIKQFIKIKSPKILSLLLGLIIIFTCQNLFTTAIPNLYLLATGQDISERLDTMGPWHTLYIGLGWRDNPDDIYYDDICGYDQYPELLQDSYTEGSASGSIATDDESVDVYLEDIFLPQTEAYIDAIKVSYFEALSGHPLIYFISYLLKVAVGLVMALRIMLFFGIPFYLVPSTIGAVAVSGLLCAAYLAAMWYMLRYCLKTQGKHILKKLLLIAALGAIALANGLLPAVVAMPTYVYLAGAAGAYDIFVILSFVVTLSHYLALRKEDIK